MAFPMAFPDPTASNQVRTAHPSAKRGAIRGMIGALGPWDYFGGWIQMVLAVNEGMYHVPSGKLT